MIGGCWWITLMYHTNTSENFEDLPEFPSCPYWFYQGMAKDKKQIIYVNKIPHKMALLLLIHHSDESLAAGAYSPTGTWVLLLTMTHMSYYD